jgi:hypothetical protein
VGLQLSSLRRLLKAFWEISSKLAERGGIVGTSAHKNQTAPGEKAKGCLYYDAVFIGICGINHTILLTV